jgi:hypothetical protein
MMKFERKPSVNDCMLFFIAVHHFVFIIVEIYNRNATRTNLDTNSLWQQVVASLNEQISTRDLLTSGSDIFSK